MVTELFTKQSDVSHFEDYGQVQLGGTTLYGRSQTSLEDEVARLEGIVESIVHAVPSADRRSLAAMINVEVAGLERRVAGAVVGSVLRKGRLSAFSGENEEGELIVVICAPSKRPEFD